MLKRIIILLFILITGNQLFSQFVKLLEFDGKNGNKPLGSLVSDGTYLYGMTSSGGNWTRGLVFKIKLDGSGYTKILDFDKNNGSGPFGSLISDGTYLYGMTYNGGNSDKGVVFKVKTDGTGYVKLLDFNGVNGSYPRGSLFSDGTYLYGMTVGGINANDSSVLFKIKTDGTGYRKLLKFNGWNTGSEPMGSLISDGVYLYGMTYRGGSGGQGTVFKIKTDGTGYASILNFDGSNGSSPRGSLIFDSSYLYGMTSAGGLSNAGLIFKIKIDGSGYTKLQDFVLTTFKTGNNPWGSLILDGTYLYGMTSSGGPGIIYGTVFKIKTDGNDYSDFFAFSLQNGAQPYGSLISDGSNLYGMTSAGGLNNMGVVFKLGKNAVGLDSKEGENFKVFPSPNDGLFYVSSNEGGIQNVSVYDMNGKLIYKKSNKQNTVSIDISGQPAGIYLVEITTKSKRFFSKIIKD